MRNKTIEKFLIKLFFRKFYREYTYIFSTSDAKIEMMPLPGKIKYFSDAKELINNETYKEEFRSATKSLIDRLALCQESEVKRLAYQLCIETIDDLNNRLIFLASKSNSGSEIPPDLENVV